MKFSLLSAAFLSLSLGVGNIFAQIVPPITAGTYYFVSRATDAFGNKLALTSSGVAGNALTVTPLLLGDLSQQWLTSSTSFPDAITVTAADGTGSVGSNTGPLKTTAGTVWRATLDTANNFTFTNTALGTSWLVQAPISGSGVVAGTPTVPTFLNFWEAIRFS